MEKLLTTRKIAEMILNTKPAYNWDEVSYDFVFKGTQFGYSVTSTDYNIWAEFESGEIIEKGFDNRLPEEKIAKRIMSFLNKYKSFN